MHDEIVMSMSVHGEGGAAMAGDIPLKRANRAGHSAREIGRHFMMKKFLLLAAIGGLVLATSMAPVEAAPRRAADGTEAATSTTQRSQSTRNRSASLGQKANRQNRSSSGNKANRNRAPRTPPAEG
jgi:hypothetical protein